MIKLTWLLSGIKAVSDGDSFIRFSPNPGFSLDFALFWLYWSRARGWHG